MHYESQPRSLELFSELDDQVAQARETMVAVTLSRLVIPPALRTFRDMEAINSQNEYISAMTDTGFIKTHDALLGAMGEDLSQTDSSEIQDNLETIVKLFIEGETSARWDRYNAWLEQPFRLWVTDGEDSPVFRSPGYTPLHINQRLKHMVEKLAEAGEVRPQSLATQAFKEIQRSTRLQLAAETQFLKRSLEH